ncbi:MAG: hypothetical protein ACK4KV_09590 [Rhodocyclaceae bacterium]
MSAPRTRAVKAPAAGGGSSGTTNTSASDGTTLAPGGMPSGAAGGDDAAAEAAREDLARRAEAVTPPGGRVDDHLGEFITGTLDEAPLQATHLHVRARRDGFRRCGRAWPVAGVEVSVDAFTDAEVERLMSDPDLLVLPVCRPLPEIE